MMFYMSLTAFYNVLRRALFWFMSLYPASSYTNPSQIITDCPRGRDCSDVFHCQPCQEARINHLKRVFFKPDFAHISHHCLSFVHSNPNSNSNSNSNSPLLHAAQSVWCKKRENGLQQLSDRWQSEQQSCRHPRLCRSLRRFTDLKTWWCTSKGKSIILNMNSYVASATTLSVIWHNFHKVTYGISAHLLYSIQCTVRQPTNNSINISQCDHQSTITNPPCSEDLGSQLGKTNQQPT